MKTGRRVDGTHTVRWPRRSARAVAVGDGRRRAGQRSRGPALGHAAVHEAWPYDQHAGPGADECVAEALREPSRPALEDP